MSNTTATSAQAPQKKNVGYRLLAVLLLAACVGFIFLPLKALAGPFYVLEKSILDIIKDIPDAPSKLFGFIPSLLMDLGTYKSLYVISTLSLYVLSLGLIVCAILSLIAIFTAKKSPCLVRVALFALTWGAAVYALSVLCIMSYLGDKLYFDLYTLLAAGVGAFFYFVLALTKVGKSALLSALHFLLALVVGGLLLYAITNKGEYVMALILEKEFYKWIFLTIVALIFINLLTASCRLMSKKGLSGDIVRYVIQLGVVLFACFLNTKVHSDNYLLYAVLAAVVATVQVLIVVAQLIQRNKAKAKLLVEEAVADFATEEYVEAYAYEGGPVAGVEIAEEVNPTEASRNGGVNVASLLGNGFDPFLIILSDEEKQDFIDLYIVKCKGAMPEIPGYVVGGDNKDFFNKVFIYLGQYREKIPSGLLAKMYKFSMKLA